MHPTYRDILAVLERYVSGVNARAMLQQSIKDAGGSSESARPEELSTVGASLRRSLAVFVREDLRQEAIAGISVACGIDVGAVQPKMVQVRIEPDISLARSEARRLCEALGTSGFTVQKVTTIVSELARNIVSYTDGGSIHLKPRTDGIPRMQLTARDGGKGIANLEEVLSGKYRSRTGLGRGIAGCRRLADEFHIETGAGGTRIDVEVRL